jgi:hypothetical protein
MQVIARLLFPVSSSRNLCNVTEYRHHADFFGPKQLKKKGEIRRFTSVSADVV